MDGSYSDVQGVNPCSTWERGFDKQRLGEVADMMVDRQLGNIRKHGEPPLGGLGIAC